MMRRAHPLCIRSASRKRCLDLHGVDAGIYTLQITFDAAVLSFSWSCASGALARSACIAPKVIWSAVDCKIDIFLLGVVANCSIVPVVSESFLR